jgi:hypothetical protein
MKAHLLDLSFFQSFCFALSIGTQFQRDTACLPQGVTSYPPDRTGQEGEMSFQKKGKSFPKKGKSFPKRGGDGGSNFSLDDHAFAMKVASALRSELEDRNSRTKLVAGWTGANERTVKNWMSGRYAPSGRHLVILAQHSDQVSMPSCRWQTGEICF